MSETLQAYRQKLRCNAPRVDEIFPGCLEEALGVMSPASVEAWLEGASVIAGLGRGQELPLIFLEEMPLVVALAGEAVIQPVAELARVLSRAGAAKAIAPLLARLPACARRLTEPVLLRDYLGLVERLAGQAPTVLPAMLERIDYLLGQLSLGGLKNWVDYGLRTYRDQPHRMGDYFALQSADSRAALQRERHGTLFVDHERRLRLYLQAFWEGEVELHPYSLAFDIERQPRPHLDQRGMHLPDVYDDVQGVTGLDRYRALLAHLAAHQRWSRPFLADNFNRYQQIFIEVFEDARVEHLAMARYPGLRRLWLALHPVPKEGACPADHSPVRHLAAMLSRALLEPGHPYTDPVLLEYVQRFHERMGADPFDTAIATDLGVEYLLRVHDVSFRLPNVYFKDTEVSYRDDNRYLWLFLEDTDEEDDFHSDHAAANPKAEEAQQPAGLTRHHPEWDQEAQYYRPDWVTVYESLQTAGEAAAIDRLLDKHRPLVKRLKRVVDLIKPQQHVRVRYQEEGSELDLDVAIRAVIDYQSGTTPDPRIHYSHKHDGRDFAVMLLLDLSQSINETVHGASATPGYEGTGAMGGFPHPGPLPEGEGDKVAAAFRAAPAGCAASILQLSQEAVSLLAEAVAAMGDPPSTPLRTGFAIAGFASNTRHEVRYFHFKGFEEPWGDAVKARLAGMQGALSTRMGAALRHAGHYLGARSADKKLLLLLSDGEPADIDVDNPAYLRADARKAVEELAMQGIASYCITLDPQADEYVADIFGRNNYSVVDRIERLPERLPQLFLSLTK